MPKYQQECPTSYSAMLSSENVLYYLRHGHAGVIELLLEYEADVSAREGWAGRTPLHYACQSGSLKVRQASTPALTRNMTP